MTPIASQVQEPCLFPQAPLPQVLVSLLQFSRVCPWTTQRSPLGALGNSVSDETLGLSRLLEATFRAKHRTNNPNFSTEHLLSNDYSTAQKAPKRNQEDSVGSRLHVLSLKQLHFQLLPAISTSTHTPQQRVWHPRRQGLAKTTLRTHGAEYGTWSSLPLLSLAPQTARPSWHTSLLLF